MTLKELCTLLCVLSASVAACEPEDNLIQRKNDAAPGAGGSGGNGGSSGVAGSSVSGSGGSANAGAAGMPIGAGGANSMEAGSPEASTADGPQDAPGGDGACAGGKALSFDGVSASVEIALGANLPIGAAARTVEMWIYSLPTSWVPDVRTPFEYGNNLLHQAFAIDFDTFPMMQIYSWSDDLVFSAPLNGAEGWFHVAASYDGAALHGFINGVQQGTKATSAPLVTPAGVVNVGRSRLVANSFFDGRIDELRIWNVARSEAEIKASMSIRLTGTEPGLVGYYRFDDGMGASARDDSRSSANATLVNQPMWIPSTAPLGCAGPN